MGLSYKEDSENYKNAKHAPYIEDDRQRYPKKKQKKKVKRSDHKHQYIKALFHDKSFIPWSLGEYCSICGRINDRTMLWNEITIQRYKEEYPVVEINSDDIFEKYISLPE